MKYEDSNLTEITVSFKSISGKFSEVIRETIANDILSENNLINIEKEEPIKIYIQKGSDVVSFDVACFNSYNQEFSHEFDINTNWYDNMSIKKYKQTTDSYNISTSMLIKDVKLNEGDFKVEFEQSNNDLLKTFDKWKEMLIRQENDYELDEVILRNKVDGKLYKVTGLKPIGIEEK